MSVRLYHSPAHILKPVVFAVQEEPFWQCFVARQPGQDAGTDVVTLFNSPGLGQEQLMAGERVEQHGVQVMVRASRREQGWIKANAIATALDAVHLAEVPLRDVNNNARLYRVWSFERMTNIICLPVTKISGGYVDEKRADDQITFVINGLASLSLIG
ncbi:MAG TPA: hypothetical protein VD932_02630 [Aquabacterium sp.]|nr:hypothetical protein [Aquabacterium sp.]